MKYFRLRLAVKASETYPITQVQSRLVEHPEWAVNCHCQSIVEVLEADAELYRSLTGRVI